MHWWNLLGGKFNHIFYSQMWNWNENYWRELELKGARRSNMITKSCCTLKGAAHRVKAFYLNKMVVHLLNLSWKPGDQNGGRGSLTDVLGTPRHQSEFWSKVQIFTKLRRPWSAFMESRVVTSPRVVNISCLALRLWRSAWRGKCCIIPIPTLFTCSFSCF